MTAILSFNGTRAKVNHEFFDKMLRTHGDQVLKGTPQGGATLITNDDSDGDIGFSPDGEGYSVNYMRSNKNTLLAIARKIGAIVQKTASLSARVADRYLQRR